MLDSARKAVLEQCPDTAGSEVDDLEVKAGKPSWRTWAARQPRVPETEGSRALLAAAKSPLLSLGRPFGEGGGQ